jgi:hypothetical protein
VSGISSKERFKEDELSQQMEEVVENTAKVNLFDA